MKETIYLKNYKPSPYLIETVELNFDLQPTETIVRSTLLLKRNPASAEKEAKLVLDGEKLTLLGVKHNGNSSTEYDILPHGIAFADIQDNDVLEITTKINPEANKALEGLYITNNLFSTQCEAEGFRRITYYLDRPDVMAAFTVRIEADIKQYPVLLSNGNLTDAGDLGDGRHFAVYLDPFKKPCYLFALVAGKLDRLTETFTTCSGKAVELNIYVELGKLEKTQHAMDAVKKSMTWDEENYGCEYDLDIFNIVAVSDFVAGAMENKSLNIFNDKYILADSKTATDLDYENIDRVVAHEYFHNWTGDRITCRDWFDLCLKEGLTVYREQAFMAYDTDPVSARIDQVITLTDRQFQEDASPLSHPVRPEAYQEINNFYTATVYEKGAEVFRMLANLVGKAGFRKATDLYFKRFDSQAVTIDDFVDVVEEANGVDLNTFKRWYSQSGTPIVKASTDYANETFQLTLSQETKSTHDQVKKYNLHIPIAVGLLDASGKSLCETTLLHLTEAKQTFTFKNISAKPVLSALRNFSSPIKFQYDYSLAELRVLALHDSDHFNRWSAMQALYNKLLVALVAGDECALPEFLKTTEQLLGKTDMCLRTLARCLTLPNNTVMLDQFDSIDLDAVLAARKQLVTAIAKHNQKRFLTLYTENQDAGEYRYENAAVNKRLLKNRCLYYLAATGDVAFLRQIAAEYEAVNNMTDESAILLALNDVACPERDAIFDAFYKKWQSEHLVVNKWLSLQAVSGIEGAFDRVKALTKHPAFNSKNPNKVYALLLQFASSNLAGFHQKDGAAYDFIGEKVLEIDAFNPQVASRLLYVFASWRAFDKGRQALMKEVLNKLASTPNISSNISEMLGKMLAT